MTILVVDDNQHDRMFIERALKKTGVGLDIQMAADGKSALDFLEQGVVPDLILLDINMPGMNGKAVLKEIKNSEVWRPIPVIMLSTADTKDEIRECLSLCANSYIVKPDSVQDYNDMAQRLVDYWVIQHAKAS